MTTLTAPASGLVHALERLDELLRDRVATLPFPPDPFHGLVLTPEDALELAVRRGPAPADRLTAGLPPGDPLARIREVFGLDPLELDVLLLALAPELDRRYERLFGYLQDDLTRTRPTVGFVLELLTETVGARLALLHRVAEDSTLVSAGLVRLVAPTPDATLAGHVVVPDRDALRWLLGAPCEVPCRPSSDHHDRLGRLGHRLPTGVGWDDLVLPADQKGTLRELCDRVRHRETVLDAWGFGRTVLGRGIVGLFAGPPGTGKTLAARVIGSELRRDVQRVDLGQVVSKYIGETEKHLDAIFSMAEARDWVLLFDEADALFGRRTEVRDAHDRYANQEVAHLLSRIEEYDGLAILTTNLVDHIDPAFLRRVTAVVHFPVPDLESRRMIWTRTWPPAAPLGADLDLERFAEHKLSGAAIRDAAVTAAYLAAATGGAVTTALVEQALRRELVKAGRADPGEG